MAEYICKDGTKYEYKTEMSMGELWQVQAVIGNTANVNAQASSKKLVELLVTSITTPDGKKHTENLEKTKLYDTCNTKDGLVLLKLLGAVLSGDEDPKETSDN